MDFIQETTIFLQPFSIFPARNKVDAISQAIQIQPEATGLLPYSFTIEDDMSMPEITLLTVNPVDPAPDESYVVDVTNTCSSPSDSVTVPIIGIDNYTDSTTCSGDVSFCDLHVPEAEALVLDHVTVIPHKTSTSLLDKYSRQVLYSTSYYCFLNLQTVVD